MKNKILVCVHIYYHNQVEYIIEKLKSLGGFDYDLFVTYSSENKETNKKFLDFDKNARFLLVENKGYDIYPFLTLINKINLEKYFCVLKLHTKNHDKTGSYIWRDQLYNNLMETKTIFRKNLGKLKKYGIIGSKNRIIEMEDYWPEDSWLFEKVCKQIGIPATKTKFVAGTIFLARIEIIKKIKELNLLQLDFESKKIETGSNSTDAHVVERLFGVICNQLGYKIYGSDQRKMFSKEWNDAVIEKTFSIKNTDTVKNIKIFGFLIKLNRYNYQISGKRNRLFLVENNKASFLRKKQIEGLDINISGNDNFIKIAKTAKFVNCKIIISSHANSVIIEDDAKLENCTFVIDKNNDQTLTINKNSSLCNEKFILTDANIE